MNSKNQYSDEHINAYIDGELDTEERARLLYDEQQDADLAQRINDARALKEKVQLAYSDIAPQTVRIKETTKKAFNCTAFVSRQRSLVAGVIVLIVAALLILPSIISDHDNLVVAKQLIKNTKAIAPEQMISTIGNNKRVVINLAGYQPDAFDNTINHIEALLQLRENDPLFKVEIVAHRDGLKALDTKTSRHADHISLLAQRYNNFDVVACAKSMADLADSGNPIKLMSDILITPSAAEQVAKRMNDGWMYLKL